MKTMRIRSGWMVVPALCALVWGGCAEGAMAQLRVTTVPAGAMVVCDGVLRDAAPVTIDGLAPGAHLVSVELAGYRSGRQTVVLGTEEKAAVEIKLEPETGLVLIHSVPSGADIEVDAAHRGKTPLLLTDLPWGTYRVRALAEGYLTREVELKVEGRTPQKLQMTLDSNSARLTVRSNPAGAAVVINGLSRGVTPCVIDRVPAGESKVVLTLVDHTSFQDTVTLRAGDDHAIDAELVPMPASLSVVGSPLGAKVYVNDQLRGQVPLMIGTIAPGEYSLRVEMAGYEPETRAVELKNRDARAEEFTLVRNVGMLEAGTDQPGTLLLVDGEGKGLLPVQTDKSVEPLRIELSVGVHQVEFRKKGYFPVMKTVAIVKGGSVSLRESMKRNFVADTVVRLKTGEVVDGLLSQKLPTGDVELETRPGIFRTIKSVDIRSVDPVAGVNP